MRQKELFIKTLCTVLENKDIINIKYRKKWDY